MNSKIKYIQYLLRHKWYVMIECFKFGLIWRGLVHDISKFYPNEFFPYANFFYGKNSNIDNKIKNKCGYCKPLNTNDPAFDSAWLHHCRKNKHHWLWWISLEDNGKTKILPIQEPYLTEMLCDWVGAAKALGHFSPKDDPYYSTRNWYVINSKKIQLAQETRKELERRMGM